MQSWPNPVFVKRRSNEWVYRDRYRCVALSRDPTMIAPHARETGRADLSMVLYPERDRSSEASAT